MVDGQYHRNTFSELLGHLTSEQPQTAKVLELKAIGDLTNDQIVKALRIPRDTVKTCLKEAEDFLHGLFGDQTVVVDEGDVPGLSIARCAIGAADRKSLVPWIDENAIWHPDDSRWRWWLRYQYLYDRDLLLRNGDDSLPPPLAELARLACEENWMSSFAKQVTVQKYIVGSRIGPHVDSRKCFPGEIVIFSVRGSATMLLTDIWAPRKCKIVLRPGDVVVLRGDARDLWKHEILRCKPADGEDPAFWYRYSITLRNVNPDRVVPFA